jgi:hypothetical protein
MTIALHPSIDHGIKQGSGSFTGGTLVCKCRDHQVKVGVKGGQDCLSHGVLRRSVCLPLARWSGPPPPSRVGAIP